MAAREQELEQELEPAAAGPPAKPPVTTHTGRYEFDDKARRAAVSTTTKVWHFFRTLLWIIGLLTVAAMVLLAVGVYKIAT